MLCKNPYLKGVIPCGCGQCMPCRINRSRMWAHRIMLETRAHVCSTFATLTYRDEELNDISDSWNGSRPLVGNLDVKDLQKWLKRLRGLYPSPIRYFAVGEYGDLTQRPHLHAAIFGFPNCIYGKTKGRNCCKPCEIISRSWGKGNVFLGELNLDSAQYIAGYVTKKWTKEDEWTKLKLQGRRPEFARMSLKPGIGATAIKNLISFTEHTRWGPTLHKSIDAPAVLRNGGLILPLGRYLKRKWREGLGRSQDTPKSVLGQYCSELQELYEEARQKERMAGTPESFLNPKSLFQWKTKQAIMNLEAKSRLVKNRRKL